MVLLSPSTGPLYACAHGIAKAALFLCAGRLPDRDLPRLRETGISRSAGWPMKAAALSIAGWPLLLGFHAKAAVGAALAGQDAVLMVVASVGTAVLLTPILLLPHRRGATPPPGRLAPLLLVLILLLGGLLSGPWSPSAWWKAAGTVAAGMLLHLVFFRRLMFVRLPGGWEKLEHVVGMTCITLILITVMVYLP
jgi:multicomponent Na+:H+ antiporter subunit D